jgi:hypothetical protein
MHTRDDYEAPSVREQVEATLRVVLSAHEASLREAADSERWERRGPLQRLVPRPSS